MNSATDYGTVHKRKLLRKKTFSGNGTVRKQDETFLYSLLSETIETFNESSDGCVKVLKQKEKLPIILWVENASLPVWERKSLKTAYKKYDSKFLDRLEQSKPANYCNVGKVLFSIDDKENKTFRTLEVNHVQKTISLPISLIEYDDKGRPHRFFNEFRESFVNFVSYIKSDFILT